MTAAIKTPNAPTPPRSWAAGGFENVEEEDGLEDGAAVLEADALPELAGLEEEEDVGPGFGVALELALEVADRGLVEVDEGPAVVRALLEDDAAVGEDDEAGLLFDVVDEDAVVAEGLDGSAFAVSGFKSEGFLPGVVVLPVFGVLPDADPVADAPAFSFTFSAVRSIVTGRLEPVLVDGFALLPGLSVGPDPLPPEEDVPPEDFLSVVI
ncbi:hypothetical protein ABVF61_26190 [Roseibium sp. HPY-6]|uniref:hypothetical protein n=1 Tax=Roseibium sp. HPY-6 TaxID=3229852 RepID=UPI00338F58C5